MPPQLRGPERTAVARELASRYRAGESIRQIAADIGRSYTYVWGLLDHAAVPMRSRGGAHPRRAAAWITSPGDTMLSIAAEITRPGQCYRNQAGSWTVANWCFGKRLDKPRPLGFEGLKRIADEAGTNLPDGSP